MCLTSLLLTVMCLFKIKKIVNKNNELTTVYFQNIYNFEYRILYLYIYIIYIIFYGDLYNLLYLFVILEFHIDG